MSLLTPRGKVLVWVLGVLVAAGCQELFPRRTPGEKLYHRLCAKCHGADGAGNTPRYMGNAWADLADGSWRHGGDPGSLEMVIREGVFGEMPGNPDLSVEEMRQLVDHVLSLSGTTRDGT